MKDKDYYDILELSPDVSQQDIKEQYRFLLHAWHPDKFPNLQQKLKAQERTKELNEAYATLNDSAMRAQYDARRSTRQADQSQQSSYQQEDKEKTERAQRRAEYERQQREKSEAEEQRVEAERQQRVKEEAERLRAERERKQKNDNVPPDFPVICSGCWCSDSTLRYTIFPYVISFAVVTFRRAWGGIYCERCRRREMLKAKLLTLLWGWWGIPFGIFYTLGTIFKPSQGQIPDDANAIYLQGLGTYFLSRGKIIDAEQAFAASLWHRYNEQLDNFYQQIFERKPQPPARIAYGQGSGFIFGFSIIVLIASIFIYISPNNSVGELRPTPFIQLSSTVRQALVHSQSPTPKPTLIAKPSPTSQQGLISKLIPKIIKSTPPIGWQKFVSKQTGFSAYIPEKFIAEEHLPKEGKPARATSFAPTAQNMQPDGTVISVIYVPYIDLVGQEPNELELKDYVNKWLTQEGMKTIVPPTKMKTKEYLGFEVVHQATMTDKKYIVQAHAAFISTHEGLYYLEVAGFVDYDKTVKQYYDTFIKWFRPGLPD